MNNLIKLTKSILFLILISSSLNAQNDAKLSIFNFNQIIYNPAFTGASEGLNFTGIYSTQWIGFDESPKTGMISLQNKFHNINSGLGLSIFNDRIGPVNDFKIDANYAYYIRLKKDLRMSFGTKIGLNSNSIDLRLLKQMHPEENYSGQSHNLLPIVGLGINLYSDNFFAGISTPNVLISKYENANFTSVIGNQKRYYYSTFGYKIENKYGYTFTPAILARITEGAPISLLSSFNVNWNKKLIGGINFEYNSSIGGYFGVNVLKNTKIGYAYDASITNFSNYNSGNHTVFLTLNLDSDYEEKCPCSFL